MKEGEVKQDECKDTIRLLKSEKASALMAELYGKEGAAENETRYEKVLTGFEQTLATGKIFFCSHHRAVRKSAETIQTITMERYLQAALTWTA